MIFEPQWVDCRTMPPPIDGSWFIGWQAGRWAYTMCGGWQDGCITHWAPLAADIGIAHALADRGRGAL